MTGQAAYSDGSLSPALVDQFHRDGYLLIPEFFDPAQPLRRARELVSTFDIAGHPMTKFTNDLDDEVHSRYFLESADKVRFFLEEDAIGPDGKLNRAQDRAVNKVGHALHLRDAVYHEFSFQPRLQNLARSLKAHRDPKILQSMIICKPPAIGGAVPHHNDSTFLYTDPPSAIGFWFALEDCTEANGCLSFMPGSHRFAPGDQPPQPSSGSRRPLEPEGEPSRRFGQARGIDRRFVRKRADGQGGTTFVPVAEGEELEWSDEKAQIGECKAGTLVLIHGSVLHQSQKNLSEKSRFIYTFHMIEGDETRATYDELNWLQPTKDSPLSSLYAPPPAPAPAPAA
ncbi:unnamed protein product [Parajaminaea phylloscopi]